MLMFGEGVFELGNPEGGGLKQFWKFRWNGGQETVHSVGGVDFSGITRCHLICKVIP